MTAPRAFTLIEVAVSIAVAGVISAVALSLYSSMIDMLRSNEVRARLAEQGNASLDYVLEEAARASGRNVPVRTSLIVEPDCGPRGPFPDCNGTDRLTVIQPLSGFGACTIVSAPPLGPMEIGRLVDGSCCLQDTPPVSEGPFKRQMLLVQQVPAPHELPVFVTLRAAGTCTFDVQPLFARADLPVPVPPMLSFDSGTAVLVDVKTFYVEFGAIPPPPVAASGTLVMHAELDGNMAAATGERLDLAQNVFDFQVALGFARPGLGAIAVESSGAPAGDDWAFNDPGGDAGFDYNTLTMVGASVMLAAQDPRAPGVGLITPWGRTRVIRAGLRATVASGRIGLRALSNGGP